MHPPPPLPPGTRVRVTAGPFAGTTGTVTSADSPAVQMTRRTWQFHRLPDAPPDAVWVLVDGFGQSTAVAFTPDELEPD